MKRCAWMLLLYLTICDNNLNDFQNKVNNALELGWKPSGSLCMTVEGGRVEEYRFTWCQALVKETK